MTEYHRRRLQGRWKGSARLVPRGRYGLAGRAEPARSARNSARAPTAHNL